MPPKAFPFSLRVGTDLCHIPRIKAILQKNTDKAGLEIKPLSRFLSKLLTWPERQYFWDRFESRESTSGSIDNIAQYLAGRWAAKEACRKACTHLNSSNGFHSIIILPIHVPEGARPEASARPQGLILREMLPPYQPGSCSHSWNRTERAYFDVNTVEGQFCEVSISHDSDHATAVAIVPHIEGEEVLQRYAENGHTTSRDTGYALKGSKDLI